VSERAASVILATYRHPELLRRVLWGYRFQSTSDFEVLVADDGSGPDTAAVVAEASSELPVPVRHVWHEDQGYRKCTILNRAVSLARSPYLIFSDGDCIPRNDFVEAHLRLRRPGRFLSGGTLRLREEATPMIDRDVIESGRATDLAWLRGTGWRPGRRQLRLVRSRRLAAFLDHVTPTSATWNGCNASVERDAVFEANGFECSLGSGGQDREFGARLNNAGLRGIQVRHRAVLVHLYHTRPYRTAESEADTLRARLEVERSGRVRAKNGIAEVTPTGKETFPRGAQSRRAPVQ